MLSAQRLFSDRHRFATERFGLRPSPPIHERHGEVVQRPGDVPVPVGMQFFFERDNPALHEFSRLIVAQCPVNLAEFVADVCLDCWAGFEKGDLIEKPRVAAAAAR